MAKVFLFFGQQGAATMRPEEELDRLTKKLVYDMNHPPAEDYFGRKLQLIRRLLIEGNEMNPVDLCCTRTGRCARCGDNVVGDGSGCIAMEQVFHVECFTCITCHTRLRGKPFYALEKKSYCENCYIVGEILPPAPVLRHYDCVILTIFCLFTVFFSEYVGALFQMFEAHSGPHLAGDGKSVPPAMLHLCGL